MTLGGRVPDIRRKFSARRPRASACVHSASGGRRRRRPWVALEPAEFRIVTPCRCWATLDRSRNKCGPEADMSPDAQKMTRILALTLEGACQKLQAENDLTDEQ